MILEALFLTLVGLWLISFIVPFILVIKSESEDNPNNWRAFLRAVFADLTGIAVLGSMWTGYQSIGTASPDFTATWMILFLSLLIAFIDAFRKDSREDQIFVLSFYSSLAVPTLLMLFITITGLFQTGNTPQKIR